MSKEDLSEPLKVSIRESGACVCEVNLIQSIIILIKVHVPCCWWRFCGGSTACTATSPCSVLKRVRAICVCVPLGGGCVSHWSVCIPLGGGECPLGVLSARSGGLCVPRRELYLPNLGCWVSAAFVTGVMGVSWSTLRVGMGEMEAGE